MLAVAVELGDLVMVVEDKARRIVLGAVDDAGLQRAEYLVVTHRHAVRAKRVRHVDEDRIADDAALEPLHSGDALARPLRAVNAATATIPPAQPDDLRLAAACPLAAH